MAVVIKPDPSLSVCVQHQVQGLGVLIESSVQVSELACCVAVNTGHCNGLVTQL